MKKIFSITVIFLFICGVARAVTPKNLRTSSVHATDIPSAAVVKKATEKPQQLSAAASKGTPTTLSASDKKTNEITSTAKAADTKRIGGIKYIKGNSLSNISNTSQPNQETEALNAQLAEMQAQIIQLQNELSKKAATEEVRELNNTINNKLENYVSADDMAAEIASAQEQTLNTATNKINVLNSKINTIANEAQIDESNIKVYFNRFLDTELTKTTNNKFAGFAKTSDVDTAKAAAIAAAGTATDSKLANYAKTSDVDTAKAAAIAAASTATDGKLANYAKTSDVNTAIAAATDATDAKLVNYAAKSDLSGLAKENELSGKFGTFLNAELTKTTDNKFAGFATKTELNTAKEEVASDATNKINTLSDRITTVASGQIDETALKGHFDRFLDTELTKTTDNKFADYAKKDEITKSALESKLSDKFTEFAKTTDLTKAKLGFVTSDDVDNTISNKGFITADNLGTTISNKKILDNYALKDEITKSALESKLSDKFTEFAKTTDLTKAKLGFVTSDDVDNTISNKGFITADNLGTTISNKKILDNYALKDEITKSALESKLSDKFAEYTKDSELSAKINEELPKIFNDDDKFSSLVSDTMIEKLADEGFVKSDVLSGYAKTTDLTKAKLGFVTSDDVNNTISSRGFVTADNLGATISNKKILDNYALKDEITKSALESKLSDKFTEFAKTTDLSKENLGFVTSADVDNTISSRGFVTADNLGATISNKKILDNYALKDEITKSALESKLSDKFTEFAKTTDLSKENLGFVTSADVDTAISNKGYLTENTLGTAISNKNILSGYAKTNEVNTAKDAAIAAAAEATDAKLADYAKTADLNDVIDAQISSNLTDSNSSLYKKFNTYAKARDIIEIEENLNSNLETMSTLQSSLLDPRTGIVTNLQKDLSSTLDVLSSEGSTFAGNATLQSTKAAQSERSTTISNAYTETGTFSTFNPKDP